MRVSAALSAPFRVTFAWLLALSLSLAPLSGDVLPVRVARALSASALTFNATNYVQVPHNASLTVPTNLTVEAWMKPSTFTGFRDIVGKTGYELAVQQAGNGFQAQFQVRVAGGWFTASTPTATPLSFNRWYHVAGTFDGSAMRLFVDGILRDTQPLAGSIDATTAPLRIGTVDGTADNFVGTIDEVRVSRVIRYTSAFTPPSASFAPDANTVGLWHLDDGSGSTATDSSASGNNGALVNAPTWTADSPFVTSDTSAPAISNMATTNVSASGATIIWTTDELATSQVEFGPTPSYGITSTLDPTLTTAHRVALAALTGNTTYHYRVVTSDLAGNRATSSDLTFTTGAPSPTSAAMGEWSPLMDWPLVAVHSVLMKTGEILLWDAWETGGTPSVRIWNPSTTAFTAVPNLASQIFCAGQVVLADGRVLTVGGHNGGEVGIRDANIFDPDTRTWSAAPSMRFARWYPGATELGDGRVLALSGNSVPGSWSNTPEVFNPATNSWSSLTVSTADVREGEYPLSYLLPNGNLFILAPSTGLTRLLDVGAQTYGASGLATAPLLNGSAAMYRPGKVLYSGGGPLGGAAVNTTAVVDMNSATPAWRTTAPMASARYEHNLTVLPTGQVLAVGGSPDVDQTSHNGARTAELWDPATESWTSLAAQRDVRQYHSTSVLLPDGRVLSAGGGRWSTAIDYLTAEIYSPPYLFKGPRPTITAAPTTATYGDSLAIATPDGANVASVALTALAANTHTSDMDSRYVDLSFTRTASGLTAQAPASATMAPPGFYLLWVISSDGVPSFARTIQITSVTHVDSQPPGVSMTGPADGSTVSGTGVTLTASASDDIGVTSVQFLLDGAPLGARATAAPYSTTWNTTATTNGPHTLSARASDAAGNTTTSTTIAVSVSNVESTPPPAPPPLLVGDRTLETTRDSNNAGLAEAFLYTATASGVSASLSFYADAATAATQVSVGVYSNAASSSPGTLLGAATLTSIQKGAWNAVPLPGVSVTAGQKYWLALLSPSGKGTLSIRDRATGSASQTSSQANLTSLPATWSPGTNWSSASASIYLSGSAEPDTTPPVISGAGASKVTPVGATVSWTTSEPSTSRVEFGATETFGSSTAADPALVTSHSQTLTSLAPSTLYYCRVLSADGAGNQTTSGTFTFTTPAAVDTTAPVISNAAAYGASSTGLSIRWTTDEAASSQVEYGPTTAYGSSTSLDPALATNHAVTLSGVPALTTYHYRVKSQDAAGNLAASPDDIASTAAPSSHPVALTIPRTGGWISPTINAGETIRWLNDDTTAHTATSDTGLWTSGIMNPGESFTWQFNTPGTYAYHCVIHGSAGVITVRDVSPPVMTSVAAGGITSGGATVTWTTSEPADTQVNYGPTTAYGTSSSLNAVLATAHSVTLSGLQASTLYHYQVMSRDAAGNLAVSADATFTTSAPAPTTVVGNTRIESSRDSNAAGSAEAFSYTATAGGAANKLYVYLDASNTATQLIVGLYSSSGSNPGTLLAQATITAPVKGAWNVAAIPNTTVVSGTKYWIAVLAPVGAGTIQMRDRTSGSASQTSNQTNLTTLPQTWSPGTTWASSALSAYVQAP